MLCTSTHIHTHTKYNITKATLLSGHILAIDSISNMNCTGKIRSSLRHFHNSLKMSPLYTSWISTIHPIALTTNPQQTFFSISPVWYTSILPSAPDIAVICSFLSFQLYSASCSRNIHFCYSWTQHSPGTQEATQDIHCMSLGELGRTFLPASERLQHQIIELTPHYSSHCSPRERGRNRAPPHTNHHL